MLFVGIIFFFGILTFLIISRESLLISKVYSEQSANEASLIAQTLRRYMLKGDARDITFYLEELKRSSKWDVGIVGNDGRAAFGTNAVIPRKILLSGAEVSAREGDSIVFYKPLPNESACHGCHNPTESQRGMIVIRRSMKAVSDEIKGTAARVMFFALVMGLTSGIFLIAFIRRLVISPLNSIKNAAEQFTQGHLDHRVTVKGNDEFSIVSDSFNRMASVISNYHNSLEETVRQRTKELRTVAELSLEVFRADLFVQEIIERFLSAIVEEIGHRYAAICLVDKYTGTLTTEFRKGIENGLCHSNIYLAGTHPFAEAVRQARPLIGEAQQLNIPASYGRVAIMPILSQRKRCRQVNACLFTECPAYSHADDRCWLIEGTLCRSPQAVAGKDKIYGCLHCSAFPVLGVLIVGIKDDAESSLYSLEICASEIAAAIENRNLMESKKQDISNLVRLHDISVTKIQSLDRHELIKSVVMSALDFAAMDASVFYLKDEAGRFLYSSSCGLDEALLPRELNPSESIAGMAIEEARPIENINLNEADCFSELIKKHGFLYICGMPLKLRGEIYGCLVLFKKKDFLMTDSEKALMMLFVSQAAAALNTAGIYERLKEEKEFSDAVFNNMSMGIMVVDNDGIIRKLNPVGRDILKADDYCLNVRLIDAMPELEAFLQSDDSLSREIELTKGSITIPIGFNNSPLLDADGVQTGTVIVFRDLTEIKKLQAELRKKQHFEVMGKVVAGVAHEIRNPLFGISSIIQILQKDASDSKMQALLDAVLKETQRMKNLIEELLLFSRPSKLNITDIDLDVFIERFIQYLKLKMPDMIVRAEVPSFIKIKGDEDKLTQVMMNLIENSANAGAHEITITAEMEKDFVLLRLIDNGSGIKKEDLGRIFDPFFTTRKEGTGLGLAICRKLIEDHKGSIDVESKQGRGTTVLLRLPVA